MRAPVIAVAGYAFVVPFGSAVVVPGLPEAFGTLSTVVAIVVSGVVVLHLLGSRDRVVRLSPAIGAWLVFAAIATSTLTWSVAPAATVRDVVVLAGLVGVYVTVSLLRIGPSDLRRVGIGVAAGGVVTGVIAVAQLVTGTLETETGQPRFTLAGGGGELGDPNVTAATLLLPLAVSLSAALRAEARSHRLVAWVAVALVMVAVLLTGSRGGLLGVGLVLVVVVLHQRRGAAAVALSVSVVLLVMLAVTSLGESTARFQELGSTGRTAIWRIGIHACPEYCPVGAGWGAFPQVHAAALVSDPAATGDLYGYEAHNLVLQVLIEAGVLGLVVLVAALWLTFRDLRAVPAAARAAPLAGLVGVVVSNLFLSTFDFKYVWLAILFATLSGNAYATARPRPHASRRSAIMLSPVVRGIR